jgi:MFS family permease
MSADSVPGGAVPAARAGQPDPRRWWVLGVVGLAQLMIVLDITVMNIALPSAQRALHFSNVDRQWVITAYALTFGSLLLFGGRLGDLFGRKMTFLTGLTGFAVASAVGGASVNFAMLITARACQGAFGALLAPAALSVLTTTFSDARERGRAFGVRLRTGSAMCACGARFPAIAARTRPATPISASRTPMRGSTRSSGAPQCSGSGSSRKRGSRSSRPAN